jgi:CheY-like chemotaxis protein
LVLSSIKPGLYDLILIDIMMPNMDGFVLYDRLKTLDPGVKTCFLTASEMHRKEIKGEHLALNKDLFLTSLSCFPQPSHSTSKLSILQKDRLQDKLGE